MAQYRYCPLCGKELGTRMIDGTQRAACSPECGFVEWNNPVPVVAGIIEYAGKVILARNRAWPPKIFALITGFLEKGETPEQGIMREVREELGLDSAVTELVGMYPYEQMNQLLIVYALKATGTVRLGDELAEIREIEPSKVRPWAVGTGPAVRDWLVKSGYLNAEAK